MKEVVLNFFSHTGEENFSEIFMSGEASSWWQGDQSVCSVLWRFLHGRTPSLEAADPPACQASTPLQECPWGGGSQKSEDVGCDHTIKVPPLFTCNGLKKRERERWGFDSYGGHLHFFDPPPVDASEGTPPRGLFPTVGLLLRRSPLKWKPPHDKWLEKVTYFL